MPELPEVETVRTDLANRLTGKKIQQLKIHFPKLREPIPTNLPRLVAGNKVISVSRRAKYLLVNFAKGSMVIHLGMSGSIRADSPKDPLRTHDHLEWSAAKQLFRYNDPRRFGRIFWTKQPEQNLLLQNCGVEPLTTKFNGNFLYQLVQRKSLPIKSLLMDNSAIAGIGNIYASEALFDAQINPLTKAHRLSLDDCKQLVTSSKKILRAAVKKGGSTLRDYSYGTGKTGYFQQQHKVYARDNKPCIKCKTTIAKIVIGQRASFYCPKCRRL